MVAAFLASSWNLVRLRADSAEVRVDCPDLTSEQAAELEARAQATLLTSDVQAQATILCHERGAEVRVEAGDDRIAVQAQAAPAALRDEVQRSLDQALYELRARRALGSGDDATAPPDAAAAAAALPPAAAPPEAAPAVPAPPTPARRPLPRRPVPTPEALISEASATLLAEIWSDRAALGGGIRAALAQPSGVELGLRAGALHPIGLGSFNANEAHLVVEGTLEPRFAAGLRVSLGIGASLLLVTPDPALSAANGTTRAALRAEAQVGRAFRWGWFQLLPSVGVHLFSEERGVRIDGREQLTLAGVGPRLSLALGYRD